MATFVLIHGAGDVGWYWHLVQAELRQRGHDAVAPDLQCEDSSATLDDYADTVIEAIGGRRDLVVVGQSTAGSPRRWWPTGRGPTCWCWSPAWSRYPVNRQHGGGTTPATARPCASKPAATAA